MPGHVRYGSKADLGDPEGSGHLAYAQGPDVADVRYGWRADSDQPPKAKNTVVLI